MNINLNPILVKKRDLPTKQFFIFPNEKQPSFSPQKSQDAKYFINSNFMVSSTKHSSQNQIKICSAKNLSRKSLDKSTNELAKITVLPSKIRIIPRQTLINSKPMTVKEFGSCSPPKDLKILTSVNRAKLGLFPDKSIATLDPIIRTTFGISPTTTTQVFSRFTKLTIMSRDKATLDARNQKPNILPQKEPLFIKRQTDRVSPKTKQRIDFCLRMDKLVAVKARSNDLKKQENINQPQINKKRNNFASEDKEQTKYIFQDKPLKSRDTPAAHLPIFMERRELTKNKFFVHLKTKFEQSVEMSHISNQVKQNFKDWKNLRSLDFFAFKTPSDFYKIKYKIGKGCFGKVYLATQILTGCDVALKVISKSNMKNKDSRRKIEKEVAILKLINKNESIIKLFEVFEDENSVCLVFEYLSNGDLVQYFKKKPLFDESELSVFFFKILKGIKYLHDSNVLHRDIKLDNILLDKNLQPKVCDFGISSIVKEGVRIYDTGGTPAYLAPEVIKAEGQVGPKSDVWSLGVLLFLLTFGVVPFKANDMQVLYNKIIVGSFKFPEVDDTSRELTDLIKKMLSVDIDKRLSLEQTMKHVWFKGIVREPTNESNLLADKEDIINDGIASYLHFVGFPEDFIARSNQKNVFNHIKACMDTLKAKFMRY